jgi:hypothetical protein
MQQRLRPTQHGLLRTMADTTTEPLALDGTVQDTKRIIQSLQAQNEGLPTEQQTTHEKLNELTDSVTSPRPAPSPVVTPTTPRRHHPASRGRNSNSRINQRRRCTIRRLRRPSRSIRMQSRSSRPNSLNRPRRLQNLPVLAMWRRWRDGTRQ